ncbi:hypothetical protein RIF29_31108 [Crotalaria pallida]|uniref:Secreted protein n=1 Tax=Crotalaria pallida TaxID=3830 RepID=A0AAN9HYM0_CROPI
MIALLKKLLTLVGAISSMLTHVSSKLCRLGLKGLCDIDLKNHKIEHADPDITEAVKVCIIETVKVQFEYMNETETKLPKRLSCSGCKSAVGELQSQPSH